MELRYVGRFSAVIFDGYGLVRRGDIITLPDEIAEQKCGECSEYCYEYERDTCNALKVRLICTPSHSTNVILCNAR